MSRKDDIRKLIQEYNRRLQKLKEQRAKFNDLHIPPHSLTEIEDTALEIKKFREELISADYTTER